MEANVFTQVLLPIALAFIMFGMGLSLQGSDFARVFLNPKAAAVGLACQMLLLPLCAYLLVLVWPLSPALAMGVLILAACPGGPTSNLVSYLARGDVALSVTLTAVNSMIAFVTAPILINFFLQLLMDEGQVVQLPLVRTIVQIFGLTVVPVLIGMGVRGRFPSLSSAAESPVRVLSLLFIVIVVAGAVLQVREQLPEFFRQAGLATGTLNVLTMLLGYGAARAFALDRRQSATISIEVGIQNGTMAIFIATTLLKQPEMSIAPAIYSLIMFATGGWMIYWFGRRLPARP